ncbi:MAG: M24 family metallopeptidase C-terminal domain-containing protein, partial [Kiloniellales bacterium]
EARWLDTYHARVRERLTPLIDPETARWLDATTTPLSKRSKSV